MPRLAANYLTVDPATGAVGANFSGHVHASGLDLDTSPIIIPPDENSIRWLTAPGGGVAADIAGLNDSFTGTDELLLRAHSPDNLSLAQFLLSATNIDQTAALKLGAGATFRILDELGRSEFFKLGSFGQSLAGSDTAIFPGGSPTSNVFTVTHNFNVGGVNGLAIGRAGGTIATFCTGEIVGTTVNTASIRATTTDGSVPAAAATKSMCYLIWTP